jgi:hypothetical protein
MSALLDVKARLLSHEVLPFYLALAALAGAALLCDAALHLLDMVWLGRHLGIPGTILIIGSFGYSLRKRKLIRTGNPATLLRLHEAMAWAGSLLILVHAGIHFNAILGWLAVWAMLVNVASGLTGKFLLQRARKRLEAAREQMRMQGVVTPDSEQSLYWDSLTFDAVKQWRTVHYPIALAFAVLALAHIVATLIFVSWK